MGSDRVLRRFREPYASDFDGVREAELMTYAGERGFPVPRIHDADQTDIVMQRVRGPSMLSSMAVRPWALHAYADARRSAQAASRPHRPDWLPRPFGAGDALLHLDLHPENVLITVDGPMVIDFQNSARGPEGADLAKTWIILATAAIPTSGIKAILLGGARQLFLRSFLRHIDVAAERAYLPAVGEAWIANPRTGDPERIATAATRSEINLPLVRQHAGRLARTGPWHNGPEGD